MTPSADMRELDADSSETTAPRLPPRDALQNTHAVFSDMPSVPAVENPRRLEIAMYWGDTRMSVLVLDTPRPVTVGYGIVDFPAFLPTGIERYVIADVSGEDTFFEVGRGMEVEIRGEDEMPLDIKRLVKLGRAPTSALDGRGTRLKLEKRERIAIALGDMVFAARWVPKQLPLGPLVKLDKHFAAALGATVIAHIFALAVMLSTPYTDPELPIEMLENPTRTAKLVLEERAKKPIPIVRENAAAAQGGKAHGDEGAAGRPSDTPRETAPSGKGVPVPSKRERDRQVARRSGLLQVLGQGRDNATASVFNPGGLGSGIDDALGGLKANARGESGGVGGAGGKGTNLGGGGKSSLGIGGVGSGSGVGQGLASVGLSGRGRATEVIPGRTVIKGCLAQEVVGRVVSRHNSQVKYCYEKELQRKPDLSGKVVAAFTIGSGGDVTETRVSESTIDDAAVEQCLMRVVTHMKFPPCEGGGTAEVTYPWLFKAGGE